MAEVKCIEVRQGAVLRHERLLDHNVLAAGAAQAHDVPVVVDDVVTTRHEKTAHIGRRVCLHGRDSTTEDSPLAKIAAARERPAPAEQEAPIDTFHCPGWRQGRGDLEARILVPDIFLRRRGKQAKLPVVHADDGEAPGARSTDSADLYAGLKEHPRIQLIAPIAPGLERPEESSLLELLERFVR